MSHHEIEGVFAGEYTNGHDLVYQLEERKREVSKSHPFSLSLFIRSYSQHRAPFVHSFLAIQREPTVWYYR